MPTKKLNFPKVEELPTQEAEPKEVKSAVQIKAEREEAERIDPPPINEVAEAIEISIVLVPLGTNHRQIRLAFDVQTNKVQPSDIPAIVESVLKRSAPLIGEQLVKIIGVEKTLLDATKQK